MEENKFDARLKSIDFLKGIAALLVCFQHACGTYGEGEYFLAISRIAVPLFVMITGYFYSTTVNEHRQEIQIKKFLNIALEMVLLYFLIDSIRKLFTGNVLEYWLSCFSFSNVSRFIVLNDPIHADHSWYMWAMIYVLILFQIFPVLYKNRNISNLIVFITVIGVPFLSKYIYFINSDINIQFYWYRNFLMPVAAYFLVGILCWEKRNIIMKIGARRWVIVVAFSIIAIFIEKYALGLYHINRAGGSYFFTVVLAVACFSLTLCLQDSNKFISIISQFGRKYALPFYIIHPLFVRIEFKVFDMHSIQQYFGYIFVVTLSLATSYFYDKAKTLLSNV